MRLLIATPALDGKFEAEYVGSLMTTLNYLGKSGLVQYVEWYHIRGVSEISRARDGIAAKMLRDGFDKLLFIDADESWSTDDITALLRSDKKLIGGTYPKKEFPINLNFGCLPEHNYYFPDLLKTEEAYEKWAAECAKDGECEIAFLPTGFMLIDRTVFEKMQEYASEYMTKDSATGEDVRCWEFFPIGVKDKRKDTEDWGFCRFARACGFPAYLAVSSVVRHHGSFRFTFPRERKPMLPLTKEEPK